VYDCLNDVLQRPTISESHEDTRHYSQMMVVRRKEGWNLENDLRHVTRLSLQRKVPQSTTVEQSQPFSNAFKCHGMI
jgi:hypothetical protein